MKPQIFLSYSHNDLDQMIHVKDSLIARGLTVWTDELLQPGSPQWESEIAQAIEASRALIVILTPSTKSSVWVARELSYAEEHSIRIFPLLVDGNEKTSIPFRLISTQRIDMRTGFAVGIRQLIEALNIFLDIQVVEESLSDSDAETISRFISSAIHDMRTPITNLMTSIMLIRNYHDRMDSQKVDEKLKGMQDQISFLTHLLDDMQDLSRLDRKLFPKPTEEIDIVSIIQSITNEHAAIAEVKDITISLSKLNEIIPVLIDEYQLRRAINNIIGNAINYTLEGGKVDVIIFQNQEHSIIKVKDTGIGIPEKDKSNIFQRFFRSENSNAISPKGTGLGLTISKEIIEHYGGSIHFESEVGKGTEFNILFPLNK